ncbi:hypothetical protein JW868_02825 [Candidatus Woesearchaeota archaeon]|nr:hypothetical protein [Candidatus Woesearchaeota archaeon]
MIAKRSQAQQAFVYIFSLLVIGALVVFGFQSIRSILNRGCEAEFITFKKDVESAIVPLGDGSYQKVLLGAPCNAHTICFVDRGDINTADGNPNTAFDSVDYPQIANSVKVMVQNNVFVVGETVEPIGYNDYIILDETEYNDRPLCIDASFGRFELGLRGRGRNVQVESLAPDSP